MTKWESACKCLLVAAKYKMFSNLSCYEYECNNSYFLHKHQQLYSGSLIQNDHSLSWLKDVIIQFSCRNYLSQNTIDWVADKWQKFTFHSFGGWQFPNQGPCRLDVWWGPASLFTDSCLFTVSSHGSRDQRSLWGSPCIDFSLTHKV